MYVVWRQLFSLFLDNGIRIPNTCHSSHLNSCIFAHQHIHQHIFCGLVWELNKCFVKAAIVTLFLQLYFFLVVSFIYLLAELAGMQHVIRRKSKKNNRGQPSTCDTMIIQSVYHCVTIRCGEYWILWNIFSHFLFHLSRIKCEVHTSARRICFSQICHFCKYILIYVFHFHGLFQMQTLRKKKKRGKRRNEKITNRTW